MLISEMTPRYRSYLKAHREPLKLVVRRRNLLTVSQKEALLRVPLYGHLVAVYVL
jgi:hypothetical protein